MSATSSLVLVGVGGAGARMAKRISDSFPGGVRLLIIDSDAASAQEAPDAPFALIGGERLAGKGAGGDVVTARLATEESISQIKRHLEDASFAVIVAGLGGGTGCGATLELLRNFTDLGITSLVFATTPFSFEGEERHRNARGSISMITERANASFFLSLDKLVGEADYVEEAMENAVQALASAVTLFWRLIERPGYIRLDLERIRRLSLNAGRGRFATIHSTGDGRALKAIKELTSSSLLADGSHDVRSIVCGILAGDDLRLSEIDEIAKGIRMAYGEKAAFELATVNDEEAFSGELCVVLMLFETKAKEEHLAKASRTRRSKVTKAVLNTPGSAFPAVSDRTIINGEDLDVPTYIRMGLTLDL